ncbi:MAG: acetylornithine aminotransferase [Methylothermaceae bacteria B42]|nr:MAG: acetylornithine aminotransferase [Methylothermaceae bacteria B42]HHJ39603.1 acetylornithine transaminase [Methylothermaceae bacterium]
MASAIMPTYARLPVTFTRGEGAWLWDTQNNRYLDAISGIAVCGLGHAHPALTEALCQQARRLWHTSNLFQIERQEALASELVRLSGMAQAFFCNSGAEANEAAIKIARAYGHQKGIEKPLIVVMDNSFHGRTLATLSATGNPKVHQGFEPLVAGFVRVPFNDIPAIESLADKDQIAAVLVEPIQGEGGIKIPASDYLTQLRALCNRHQWLLILDEVQTGMGRTGQWFAFQHENITPDVLTLAKALGNGFPIGACLVRGKAVDILKPGMHGSTFGGNPLACSAALAVIKTLEQENLISRAQQLGEQLMEGFSQSLSGLSHLQEIRGRGLMLGIELKIPCGSLVNDALKKGILINVTAEQVVRLLPPLILTDQQAKELIETLSSLITGLPS